MRGSTLISRRRRSWPTAHGAGYVRDLFAANGILPGLWGLPVAWNQDHWRDDLAQLPSLAALGAELGCTRTATWCPSWSDSRPYEENWAWHIERYRPIAQVLAEHGCRLGIEFLGPKTLRTGHPYEFISTMDEMLRLAADIGTGNVGLLLDAYHQYTGHGTPADLDRITAADVVTVHVNDALADVPIDELPDLVRCLPLETGVIDLADLYAQAGADGVRRAGDDGTIQRPHQRDRSRESAGRRTRSVGSDG